MEGEASPVSVGTRLYPVGLSWVGQQSGSKTAAGTGGRQPCGIPSGCCRDSFSLSIRRCPQQLLETEGLKMPRAETHKSRLGWNKKEDEIGWGGGGRGGRDCFIITNMERGKGLHVSV